MVFTLTLRKRNMSYKEKKPN